MIAGMNLDSSLTPAAGAPGWHARLDLAFSRRGGGTVLSRRAHRGPLRVQKALHPEGEAVCHGIVLHPPSGIAGGDDLEIRVAVEAGGHALLTTPGAGKWYRSAGPRAAQRLRLSAAPGAVLEWLPQENIVFAGALADLDTRVELAGDARLIAWDILCLGRRASGERFDRGNLRLASRIERDGQPLWLERGALDGGSPLLDSAAGLAGFSVSATLLASGPGLDAALLAACREVPAPAGQAGISLLPDLLVARHLGHSAEAARHWFAALWGILRPALAGRAAQTPRIWNT